VRARLHHEVVPTLTRYSHANVASMKAYGRAPAVSIGRCIYCRTTDGPLTREHVIPKGLGGHLVLHEATCTPCQKLIGKIETAVLRDSLRAFSREIEVSEPDEGLASRSDAPGDR
jgi:5-methylcytosine-specific restriction endonuclease McrA